MEAEVRTTQGGEAHGRDVSPEQRQVLTPRIYVASLTDYNAGRLYGAWLDAAQDADELHDAVARMLHASPEPVAEEYAIHDYEGFGPLRLDEFTDLDTVSRLARG